MNLLTGIDFYQFSSGMSLSLFVHPVSKNARLADGMQPQSGLSTPLGVVCVIVNLIVGWMLFNSDRNRCKFFKHPV